MQRKLHGTLALVLALSAGTISMDPARACSFHDPSMVMRGIMNHVYPESLHVMGAVMQAQRVGELPRSSLSDLSLGDESLVTLKHREFEQTLRALYALGLAVEERRDEGAETGVSLVLLESLLWTRYSPDYENVRQGLHVNGPDPDDIILVTEKPVLTSIQAGAMTVERAVELGVIRIYADERDIQALMTRIGSIGENPLPASGYALNQFGVSTSDWAPVDILRPTP